MSSGGSSTALGTFPFIIKIADTTANWPAYVSWLLIPVFLSCQLSTLQWLLIPQAWSHASISTATDGAPFLLSCQCQRTSAGLWMLDYRWETWMDVLLPWLQSLRQYSGETRLLATVTLYSSDSDVVYTVTLTTHVLVCILCCAESSPG